MIVEKLIFNCAIKLKHLVGEFIQLTLITTEIIKLKLFETNFMNILDTCMNA
jgi:hypothetical protein